MALGAGLGLLGPGPAGSAVYTWTDTQGHVHMTDDLSRVPESERALAPVPRASGGTWNRVDPDPSGSTRASPAAPGAAAEGAIARRSGRRYRIRVERAGLEMRVSALLEGRIHASFKVDTGAAINTIPRQAVEALGVRIDESTPVTVVAGISGEPMLVPVVTLREVALGGAMVENVEMAVLDTMAQGLLGMPFFNHFRVETDPERGILTLEEIDLAGVEGIYGGYGESYWRARFRMIRTLRDRLDQLAERLPSTGSDLRTRMEHSRDYWRRQLEQLELRASRAGVPRSWRH
ncbi:MAG: aspartyl protease family protein [Myxococcota bacterium]